MQVSKFRNEPKAMPQVVPGEFIYVLTSANIEQVTADPNILFQKLWIYPAKAVGTGGTLGELTPNAAPVRIGKSGPAVSLTLTKLELGAGADARATFASHGLPNGATVAIAGATPSAYNGTFVIFNASRDTFDYRPLSNPAGPATGTITAKRVQFLSDVLEPTDLPTPGAPGNPFKIDLPLGQTMRLDQIIVKGTATDGVQVNWT